MSISELNHFMTYVLDGWMLFSAGFISVGFVSFVSKRIQEDIEAGALALAQAEAQAEGETVVEAESVSTIEAVSVAAAKPSLGKTEPSVDNIDSEAPANEPSEEEAEAARLEEVAAVSEQLAKTKGKQTDTSSVSVST